MPTPSEQSRGLPGAPAGGQAPTKPTTLADLRRVCLGLESQSAVDAAEREELLGLLAAVEGQAAALREQLADVQAKAAAAGVTLDREIDPATSPLAAAAYALVVVQCGDFNQQQMWLRRYGWKLGQAGWGPPHGGAMPFNVARDFQARRVAEAVKGLLK